MFYICYHGEKVINVISSYGEDDSSYIKSVVPSVIYVSTEGCPSDPLSSKPNIVHISHLIHHKIDKVYENMNTFLFFVCRGTSANSS